MYVFTKHANIFHRSHHRCTSFLNDNSHFFSHFKSANEEQELGPTHSLHESRPCGKVTR